MLAMEVTCRFDVIGNAVGHFLWLLPGLPATGHLGPICPLPDLCSAQKSGDKTQCGFMSSGFATACTAEHFINRQLDLPSSPVSVRHFQ
jgi:hypothetical protein